MWLVFTDAGDGGKVPPQKVSFRSENINAIGQINWDRTGNGHKNAAKTWIGISDSFQCYAELLDDFDDVVKRVQQAQAQAQMLRTNTSPGWALGQKL